MLRSRHAPQSVNGWCLTAPADLYAFMGRRSGHLYGHLQMGILVNSHCLRTAIGHRILIGINSKHRLVAVPDGQQAKAEARDRSTISSWEPARQGGCGGNAESGSSGEDASFRDVSTLHREEQDSARLSFTSYTKQRSDGCLPRRPARLPHELRHRK